MLSASKLYCIYNLNINVYIFNTITIQLILYIPRNYYFEITLKLLCNCIIYTHSRIMFYCNYKSTCSMRGQQGAIEMKLSSIMRFLKSITSIKMHTMY